VAGDGPVAWVAESAGGRTVLAMDVPAMGGSGARPRGRAIGTVGRRAGSRWTLALLALVTAGALAGCAGAVRDDGTDRPAATGAPDPAPVVVEETTTTLAPTSSAPASTVPASTVPPLETETGPGTEQAFVQLRAEEGGEIVRWGRTEVSVSVHGAATATDRFILAEFIDRVATIPGVPRLVLTAGTADIAVHFLPKQRWGEVLGTTETDPSVDGKARYLRRGGIVRSEVVVDSTSRQVQRNRTLVHEMLHALGPGHHRCPGGMLHDGVGYDPDWTLRDYDIALLRAWYADHPSTPRVGVDLPCPAVRWSNAEIGGERFWCRSGDGSCYRVDERRGVLDREEPRWWLTAGTVYDHDPARYRRIFSEGRRILCELPGDGRRYARCETTDGTAITTVNRWYDGQRVYDHDPETHTAARYEGRRILCEVLPPGGGRAPCQITNGTTLTGVDYYTDGTWIYPDP